MYSEQAEMSEQKAAIMEQKVYEKAEQMFHKYRKWMDALNESNLSKVRGGSITPYDAFDLGRQLEDWDTYYAICEEEGKFLLS